VVRAGFERLAVSDGRDFAGKNGAATHTNVS